MFNMFSNEFEKPTASSGQVKLVIVIAILLILISLEGISQNVGIGNTNPMRKLSVSGSIMLDQGNDNNGTLDTSALVFGSGGNVGIVSRKTGTGVVNGLSFFTNGVANMHIASDGRVSIGAAPSGTQKFRVMNGNSYFENDVHADGSLSALTRAAIGGALDPAYRLRVWDGATRFGGDMHATGNVAFGGEVDNNYRLRVIGGNSRFGGDLYATGNAAFGGNVDAAYRLRVHNGNSLLGGNLQVIGHATVSNMTVSNSLTIDGKGSVRSNGTSPLRIGFDKKTVDVVVNNGESIAVLADITDFSGDYDDVRVFVSQIEIGVGSANWQGCTIMPSSVNATNNTVLLWIHNHSGGLGILKGTIYLTTIAKN